MQRRWLRLMVRYPVVTLVKQGRLTQAEAARKIAVSTVASTNVNWRPRQDSNLQPAA